MSQNNKEALNLNPNYSNFKNIIDSPNKRNNFIIYSEQSSNDITFIPNNRTTKLISLKTNYIPSQISLITNKFSSENISDYSYSEHKTNQNKNNPLAIFDNHKSLFTSIEDRAKTYINRNKDNSLVKNKKKNKSINILFHNSSSKRNNLILLLKKMALVKTEINSLNKNEQKLKLVLIKNKNKKKIKINDSKNIPKILLKKTNYSFINNKIKSYNINMKNAIKENNFKYSLSKDKLPNISIEDKLNSKITKNILTSPKSISYKNKKVKNNINLNTLSKTLITFDKNKTKIENKKNHDFIKNIKNKQLMNLVRRFKILENKNNQAEIISYKNNIFPSDTIKLIFSKRKELAIDKFRNEYLLKLENTSINNY